MAAKPKLVTRDNGMIYVHWTDHIGKLQRKSCDTKDMKLARTRMSEVMNGEIVAPTPAENAAAKRAAATESRKLTCDNVTMAHLFDRCLRTCWAPTRVRSQKTIQSQIRILNRLVGGERVRSMTYRRLEELVSQLRAMNYSEATVDRKMSSIGAALRQACKETDDEGRVWLDGRPPMPTLAYDNLRDRVLSPAEEVAVFAAIAARALAEPHRDWKRYGYLIRFLLDMGCRKGDALGVVIQDITDQDVKGQTMKFVTLRNGKAKVGKRKTRMLPLSTAIVQSLEYLHLAAVDQRLFPFQHGAVNYYWTNIRADVKANYNLNIDDVVIHTLRHSCISAKARKSNNIHKVSLWAGHSDVNITAKRYAHLMPQDMVDLL